MPSMRVLDALAGTPGGRILVVTTGADPAAGAEISFTVSGRSALRVHAITAVLTTSATAANRVPHFIVSNGETTLYEVCGADAHTAGLAVRYSLIPHGAVVSEIAALSVVLPLPELYLLPGWTLTTSTDAIEADDNWGAPALYVTEIPERGEGVWDDLLAALAAEIDQRRQ